MFKVRLLSYFWRMNSADLLSDIANCSITPWPVFNSKFKCNHSLRRFNKVAIVSCQTFHIFPFQSVPLRSPGLLHWGFTVRVVGKSNDCLSNECSLFKKMRGRQCKRGGGASFEDVREATGSSTQPQASSFSARHSPLPVDVCAACRHFAKSQWLITLGALNNYRAIWSSMPHKLMVSLHETTPGRDNILGIKSDMTDKSLKLLF